MTNRQDVTRLILVTSNSRHPIAGMISWQGRYSVPDDGFFSGRPQSCAGFVNRVE